MKKSISLLVVLMMIITIIGCKRKNVEENKIFTLDLDNCKREIELKLSNLIDSCRFISLETTNESLLGDWIRYLHIGRDFIIILDNRSGILKFQSNGKFVKKLINVGRGPGEIRGSSSSCFYQESEHVLFIEDILANPNIILRYDIKAETFLSPINKCFKDRWTNFIVFEDSLILGSIEGLSRGETNPYGLFIQNFKGEFITGIKSNRSFILPRDGAEEVLQRMVIFPGDESIHVKYRFDDTLFKYKDNTLSPYIIVNYKDKKTMPRMLPLEGDRGVGFDEYENHSYMIIDFYLLSSWRTIQEGWSSAHYQYSYFLLDKSLGEYSKIKSYTDDLIGKTQSDETGRFKFPTSLPNNILVVSYTPIDLLAETTHKGNGDFNTKIINQLHLIKSNLKETDNPVLLIGTPQKHILKMKQ